MSGILLTRLEIEVGKIVINLATKEEYLVIAICKHEQTDELLTVCASRKGPIIAIPVESFCVGRFLLKE